jgi:hypothetical protein
MGYANVLGREVPNLMSNARDSASHQSVVEYR